EDGIRDRNVAGVQTCALPMRKLAEQTKNSVENMTNEMEEVQKSSNSVSQEFDQLSDNLSSRVEQTNVSMEAIDKIMSHLDEVNEAIKTIASFTDQEAGRTKEMSERVHKLSEYFENTKRLTMQTGSSVHAAGVGVNNIRLHANQSLKTPTEQQQIRLDETEEKVANWLEYNKTNQF